MRNFLRMLALVRPYKGKFALFMVCALIYGAAFAMPFLLAKTVLERLLQIDAPETPGGEYLTMFSDLTLNQLVGIVAVLFIVIAAFDWARTYIPRWIAARAVTDVNNSLMRHLLRLELGYFERQRSGDLMSRIGSDSTALQQVVQMLGIIIREPLTATSLYIAALLLDWRLTLLGSVGFPLAALAVNPLLKQIRKASKRGRESMGERSDALHQFFNGVRTVKAYALEELEYAEYERVNERVFKYNVRQARANALTRPVVSLLAGVGVSAVILLGGHAAMNNTLDPMKLLACITALMALHQPIKETLKAVNMANETLPGAERLFEVLDVQPSLTDAPDAEDLKAFRDAIRFEDVTFSYGRQPVLENVDLEIAAGQTVALVGPSGSGKTTIASLVVRFYDPVSGRVTIDGHDLRQIQRESLLNLIAVVTQEPFLFNISVRENIRQGRPGATDEEVEQAARAANVHDEILQFPQGYDTLAGERGTALSGGQRQRVSIARAIVRNSPILVLDEATSSLDSASEKLVQQAIDHLVEDRTSIVIAHRLSTVRNADKIVVVRDGRIIGQGSHDELLAENAVYRELWSIQSGQPMADPVER
jgi:subfamily B ATP-binding cassette protein MsbA